MPNSPSNPSAHLERIARAAKKIFSGQRNSLILAFALIVLSSAGWVDNSAQKHVETTRNESIGIYALARGINALVSVAQSSQVKVPFVLSIQAGELLDPVNDAVERLSSVMVWSTGSLFLQQIVLEVASSLWFRVAFLAIGALTMFALLRPNLGRFRNLAWRIFIVAAAFRFIVPAFVLLSVLAGQMLLGAKINENREKLSSFEKQLPIEAALASPDAKNLDERKAHMESERERLRKDLTSLKQKAENLDKEIDRLDKNVGWARRFLETLRYKSPGNERAALKEKRAEIGREIKESETRIDGLESKLDCIERHRAGENCDSWWDKIASTGKTLSDFMGIYDKAKQVVQSITDLLIAIVIKNILLPLVFLLIALKCTLPLARYGAGLASGFRRDWKELRERAQLKD